MTEDIYRMERTILDYPNRTIAKEYVVGFVYANRRRVRELEKEIHELKESQLIGQSRSLKQGT